METHRTAKAYRDQKIGLNNKNPDQFGRAPTISNAAKEGWGMDSEHRWQTRPTVRANKDSKEWETSKMHRVQTRPTATKQGRRAALPTSEDKQGWLLGKRRTTTKVTGYRVESGDRGRSRARNLGGQEKHVDRKQRELKATKKSHLHREELGLRAGIKSCLDHVAVHMFGGKGGKSSFKATKLCDIWSLIYRTLTCPDEEIEDNTNKDRLVFKKKFSTPIGVHGLTRKQCYTVKVVYDHLKRRLITAYPIHP